MYYHDPLFYFGFFSLFWLLAKIAFIIFIIWLLVRIFSRRNPERWHHYANRWQSHSALSILNERYAKGEINKEEYEERKKTLMGQ